jgi:uncharacterized protein YecT (DUF1311 family)
MSIINRLVLVLVFLLCSFCLSAQDYDWLEAKKVEFGQDTARVEQDVRDMLNKDYSTVGMIEATVYLEKKYDELLNKYYKVLMSTLDEENKKLLKESQRNWMSLRDSDLKLIRGMKRQAYKEAGGGTVWGVVAASASADVTRRRVFELFDYLLFSSLN